MADKRIHELDELTTPQSNDLLVMEQSSTNVDKKVKFSNLMPYDTMVSIITSILEAHPEWTTTVEDGSIDIDKLATDTLALINSKAETDGYYEDMAVGSAEQLLSNIFETDNTPYLYRTSGGSVEIGDRVYEDALVGGSVAWNQLRNNYTASGVFSGVTLTNNTTNIDLSGTADSATTIPITANINFLRDNRVYLILFNQPVRRFGIRGYGNLMGDTEGYGFMFKQSASTGWANSIAYNTQENVAVSYSNLKVNVFDLYRMFGSTIADYAYTLETSEAGSGIAWLKSQGFFTKDYYAYNAGGIQSVKTSAKKVVGFNQWDEEWEVGSINSSNGEKVTQNDRIRSKNYISVVPNTIYHYQLTQNIQVYFYDKDKNYISYFAYNVVAREFTTPQNCYYILFNTNANYGTTYKNDICINFHWDGERDGEYEAYEEHTYPLDSDLELRGMPKLVDGKIKYDGDTYASDGTVTRKYGIVELGSLTTWVENHNDTNAYEASATFNLRAPGVNNFICNKLEYKAYSDTADYGIRGFGGSGGIAIKVPKTVASSAAAVKQWLTDNNVIMVYPLATPTTESADPYTSPQWISNWGTEEFVDTRDVPIPVGHDSRYLPDLKAKLESAPSNPSTNGKYFLQYQNGEATYVPVPSEVPQTPSEDGTYVLKATVSSGTATLSWVAEE